MIPQENSEDLTDAEIQSAIPTENQEDFTAKAAKEHTQTAGKCTECWNPSRAGFARRVFAPSSLDIKLKAQDLRLRKPDLYWVFRYECEGPVPHKFTKVFKVSWLVEAQNHE